MARFAYKGRSRKGAEKGKVTADTKRAALMKLQQNNIRVTEIVELEETMLTRDLTIGNPVKLDHLVIFLRQFSVLLQAGVPVAAATSILTKQTESKALKKALVSVESELREGRPLSDAASRQRNIFEPLFINMLRAGEAMGNLDETFNDLANHYERQYRTRQKVISALTYPIAVGIIAVIVVIFLLVAVVPSFVNMFADFGGELPAITLFVINASEWMQSYWLLILLFLALLGGGIGLLRRHKKTKYYYDYAMMKMPVFGSLIQKAALARLTRTLSSLFSNSVPILQALEMVEEVVGNDVIGEVIVESRQALETGESLTGPMKRHWAFPPLVSNMIAIGEETGSLDAMLSKVADFYEQEVEAVTDRLKSLIEPLMIVFLAGVVGVIVAAIMVPMFEIFNTIQ
ncbi:type II secretion system F family protein [Domibacillus iocasae]|uniref:Type II secretion system protein F n=1 Tax=Domibacillus iocasae TaxID=1714016 RepID=A0A1E7DMB9_9BACI|nr:type II secretion system F family protein [Domibacillus iocasae]OES44230.1 type II secretion system protein F [Domibacillus iocasae]